jgi:molybdopterin converting factor small subunit
MSEFPEKRIMITVKLFSFFCSFAGKEENRYFFEMNIPEGVTGGKVASLLKIPEGIPRVVLINGTVKEEGYLLQEGDEMSILPFIEGG